MDDKDKCIISKYLVRSNCQVSISHNFSIMFRSGGTTWLLVFIGLIFVAVITGADQESDPLYDYGNSGCWLFKRGVQNWKYFCIKIDRKKKLLNFENWCDGEVSKSALIWQVKNHQNLSPFFSLKNINLGPHFLLLKLKFSKMMSNFWQVPITPIFKIQEFSLGILILRQKSF